MKIVTVFPHSHTLLNLKKNFYKYGNESNKVSLRLTKVLGKISGSGPHLSLMRGKVPDRHVIMVTLLLCPIV